MNKLEIKDLTGYLPYGLQCERFDGKIEIFCIDNIPTALLTNYKPILRPMSDLLHIEIEDTQFALSEIKDILSLDEAEGVYSNVETDYDKREIIFSVLKEDYLVLSYNLDICWSKDRYYRIPLYTYSEIINVLNKYKFDYRHLIWQGLAIDINKINE